MTFPDYLYLAVVLLVGGTAAVRIGASGRLYMRNASAAALVVSYFAAQGLWLATGLAFEPRISLLVDLTVIGVIYCKAPAQDCWPYADWREQLCAAWFERSVWDRLILALFPCMWAVYFLPIPYDQQWWSLYWCAIAQFIAAGGESLQSYLNARSAKAVVAPESSAGSQYTANWREWGYG